MSRTRLFSSFKETKYQLAGHGTRNVHVLKEAFQDIEGSLESDLYVQGKDIPVMGLQPCRSNLYLICFMFIFIIRKKRWRMSSFRFIRKQALA